MESARYGVRMGWRAAGLAWGACLLWGCGPAPYALDPEPPPPAAVVVQPAQQVVLVPAYAVPAPMVAPAPHPLIDPTVRSNYPRLRKCFDKGLRKNPALRGQLVVRLEIEDDGDVDDAHDHGSDLPDRKVIECMLDVFEDMEFPRAAGGMSTVYALYFTR